MTTNDNTSARAGLDLDAVEARARDNEDFRTYHLAQDSADDVPALLAEVRRLRGLLDAETAAHRGDLRDDAKALDDLVAQVWRAAGEEHEPPADVDALVRRVAWTRDRLVAGRESDTTLRKAVIALTVSEAETVAKCNARIAAARREGAEAMREACAKTCDRRAEVLDATLKENLIDEPYASEERGAWSEAVDLAAALRALPLPGGEP